MHLNFIAKGISPVGHRSKGEEIETGTFHFVNNVTRFTT